MFGRFGSVGSIGGVLLAFWADRHKDSNTPDFSGHLEAEFRSDEAKKAALTHQDSQAAKNLILIERAAILVAVVSALQWGFGDLLFKTECSTC